MKRHRLTNVWLVAATLALAACAPKLVKTPPTSAATTAALTTVFEDSAGPTPSAADSVAPTVGSPEPSASKLLALRLPGMNLNEPAGEYGWTGALGERGWMHRVIEDPPGQTRQTQLAFTVEDDCFARSLGAEPSVVTVAGLDGRYLEPYDDDSMHWSTSIPSGGETTAAYALPIDDRTLCTYLRWDPATTPDELSAAREVVESIRGEPYGEDGIRINFTLPFGWDTG